MQWCLGDLQQRSNRYIGIATQLWCGMNGPYGSYISQYINSLCRGNPFTSMLALYLKVYKENEEKKRNKTSHYPTRKVNNFSVTLWEPDRKQTFLSPCPYGWVPFIVNWVADLIQLIHHSMCLCNLVSLTQFISHFSTCMILTIRRYRSQLKCYRRNSSRIPFTQSILALIRIPTPNVNCNHE